MESQKQIEQWVDLPNRVKQCVEQVLPVAIDLRKAAALFNDDTTTLWVHQSGQDIYVQTHDPVVSLTYKDAVIGKGYDSGEDIPDAEYVLVKQGSLNGVLSTMSAPYRYPADILGRLSGANGATPLTSALTTGAINAALGYGGAHLWNNYLVKPLHEQFPDTFKEEGIDPNIAAGIGATTALGPLAYGVEAARAKANAGNQLGFRDYVGLSSYGQPKSAEKLANLMGATGGLNAPSIPVDAFNRTVWAPWVADNPYGTKKSFGTNEQQMLEGTAAMSGLVTGVSAAKKSPLISFSDIASTAGYSAAGWGAAKLVGSIVGLQPEAKKTLQNSGLMGGLLYGASRSLGLVP